MQSSCIQAGRAHHSGCYPSADVLIKEIFKLFTSVQFNQAGGKQSLVTYVQMEQSSSTRGLSLNRFSNMNSFTRLHFSPHIAKLLGLRDVGDNGTIYSPSGVSQGPNLISGTFLESYDVPIDSPSTMDLFTGSFPINPSLSQVYVHL